MNEIKKKIVKNKMLLVFTICVIAAAVVVLISPSIQKSDAISNSTGEFQQSNVLASAEDAPVQEFFPPTTDTTPEFVRIQADELQMKSNLGLDAIFPEYYRIVRGNMLLGYSEEDAVYDAQTYLIGREAMYRYVTDLGFGVTDEEVALHIEKVLKELSQTDNFDEVAADYTDAQVDWQETVRSNYEYYRQTLAVKNYIDSYMPPSVEPGFDPDTGELVIPPVPVEVSKLETLAMEKYKGTPHFEELSKAFNDMAMFMSKNKDNLVTAALNDESIASITYKEPLSKAITAKDDLALAKNSTVATGRKQGDEGKATDKQTEPQIAEELKN